MGSHDTRAYALIDVAARTEAVGAWLSDLGQREAALFYYGRASRLRGMALMLETERQIEALDLPG